MQITVKEVQGKKELKAFYQFQNRLYEGCPQYVPSLDADQKSTLTEDPALEYCTRKMWLFCLPDKIFNCSLCTNTSEHCRKVGNGSHLALLVALLHRNNGIPVGKLL